MIVLCLDVAVRRCAAKSWWNWSSYFCGAGVWTQGPVHARQVLYHVIYAPSVDFCFIIFLFLETGSHCCVCVGWVWIPDPPTSVSQIAGISDLHHTLVLILDFQNIFETTAFIIKIWYSKRLLLGKCICMTSEPILATFRAHYWFVQMESTKSYFKIQCYLMGISAVISFLLGWKTINIYI
jgi:hypothetical protein